MWNSTAEVTANNTAKTNPLILLMSDPEIRQLFLAASGGRESLSSDELHYIFPGISFGDTAMTLEEFQHFAEKQFFSGSAEEMLEAFHMFDHDANGTISVHDLQNVLNDDGLDIPCEELQDMISVADRASANAVSFLDFQHFMSVALKRSSGRKK
eukprot:TRINITY_DN10549_c0_g1_i1.p1 TRINITY_DN10549_c0_g1~~TRINITY_DN10549_c0_g1_i1.p1  ORF type:complete len:155 (+),score=31.54 TRINITY_DN10549_c0_g1_i1:224-688(+)